MFGKSVRECLGLCLNHNCLSFCYVCFDRMNKDENKFKESYQQHTSWYRLLQIDADDHTSLHPCVSLHTILLVSPLLWTIDLEHYSTHCQTLPPTFKCVCSYTIRMRNSTLSPSSLSLSNHATLHKCKSKNTCSFTIMLH